MLITLWCCSLHTGSTLSSSSSVSRMRWASMLSTRTTLRWRSTTPTLPRSQLSSSAHRMPLVKATHASLTIRELGSLPVTSNAVLITRHAPRMDSTLRESFRTVRRLSTVLSSNQFIYFVVHVITSHWVLHRLELSLIMCFMRFIVLFFILVLTVVYSLWLAVPHWWQMNL